MTDQEIQTLLAQAEAEANQSEEAMLVSPLAVIGIIERLWNCERARVESESYDQLAGG